MEMMKMFESVLGKLNEKQKERIMEQCLLFMTEQENDNDRECNGKKKEEPVCPPDMGRVAGCCPEMMEQFLSTMRNCLGEKGRTREDGKERKTEKAGCCQ